MDFTNEIKAASRKEETKEERKKTKSVTTWSIKLKQQRERLKDCQKNKRSSNFASGRSLCQSNHHLCENVVSFCVGQKQNRLGKEEKKNFKLATILPEYSPLLYNVQSDAIKLGDVKIFLVQENEFGNTEANYYSSIWRSKNVSFNIHWIPSTCVTLNTGELYVKHRALRNIGVGVER